MKNELHNTRVALKVAVLLSLLLTLSVFYGCKVKSGYKWVFYDETYCSDDWKASNNNETLKQNVVNYFDGEGVTIYDIEIYSDRDIEPYNSCNNKTGRRIKCKIKSHDLSTLKGAGFYE
jgi:hypothetical protein